MKKFEVPYNLDPSFPVKLMQHPDLLPHIECIYAAAWKEDCDNTRFDITYREDYPKTYEEYEQRLKGLIALGIPVCILAQKRATLKMIRKYRALGIRQFILNDDKLAAKIKGYYPDTKLPLSITRAAKLEALQTGDFSMYDRIVLFHWFNRHLNEMSQLPSEYEYILICNSGCYHDCQWHGKHWFLQADTQEEYGRQSDAVCKSCATLLQQGKRQSAYVVPEDLGYFEPYVAAYKLADHYDDTDAILNNLYRYANRTGGESKPVDYYNL